MNPNDLAVLFTVEHGGRLLVTMPAGEARGILGAFLAGTLKDRIGQEVVAAPWGLDTARIQIIQIFTAEQLVGAGLAAQATTAPVAVPVGLTGGRLPPGTSGYPR